MVELLHDPSRCRVLLVTLPEEMPVSETVEAAYLLEDQAGVQLGPVVVNCWDEQPAGLGPTAAEAAAEAGVSLPAAEVAALEAARAFRLRRHELAAAQVERLGRELPLPQLRLPALAAPAIGPDRARPPRRARWPKGWRRSPRNGGRRDRLADGAPTAALARRCPSLAATRPVVVCCGPGGVGKTTVAATFALQAARAGPQGLRGHGRPGPAPGRRARRRVAAQHADRRARATGPASCTP